MALKVVPTPKQPRRTPRVASKSKAVRVGDIALARSRQKVRRRDERPYEPFAPALHPPAVLKDVDDKPLPTLAMDDRIAETAAWAQNALGSAFAEGVTFLGYAALSVLAQRPEYRVISECLAYEMTREWIEFESDGKDDKTEKIKLLTDALDELGVQEAFRCAALQDGFFGRSHIYIDTGDTDDRDELKTSLGDGSNLISRAKFAVPSESESGDEDQPKRKRLVGFRPVEAVWVYPTRYDSIDPLKKEWYKPETWFVMGKEIHRTRLLPFIGREVSDLLKPAYSFGGLSMTQMAKPYVDNWLKIRQSVADIVQAFSVFVLKTSLGNSLMEGGDEVFKRAEFFNNVRDNRGLMVLDKELEDFANVQASLASLPDLQSQSQEHMAAVSRTPVVKLLGIQPAGLNASSEGEIRAYYDWIHAFQEFLFRSHLTTVVNFIQLDRFGYVDPAITFRFKDLWQLDEAGKAGIQQTKAATRETDIASGVISPEEGRKAAAADKDSQYAGLDLADTPPPPPAPAPGEGGDPGGTPKLEAHPAGGLGRRITNKAAEFGGAAGEGFKGDLGIDGGAADDGSRPFRTVH